MLCHLPDTALIRFSGDDSQTFLHNLLTCDVAALEPGRSTYGGFSTPKGRLLASFLLWRTEDAFYMQLPASLREPIQAQLGKFILRSKVKAADATGDWTLLGILGSDGPTLVERAVGSVPQAVHEFTRSADALAIRLPGDRFEVVGASDKGRQILEALSRGREVEADQWQWLDIRGGIPVITPATQEEFVPQMVNLDLIGGVSFEKGCYPGQEIVARMHYRGTLKQRMYLANIESAEKPRPGDKVYSPGFGEQACGTLVNSVRSPNGGFDVLASLQISAAQHGDVRWKSAGGPALKLRPLPYAL